MIPARKSREDFVARRDGVPLPQRRAISEIPKFLKMSVRLLSEKITAFMPSNMGVSDNRGP